MTSNDGEAGPIGAQTNELLEDEEPPDIPDIASDPEPEALSVDVEFDPEPERSEPRSLRRLSPPPKPRHRDRSITAPQTPASRLPPMSDESLTIALKPPLIPSLTEPEQALPPLEPATQTALPNAVQLPPPLSSPLSTRVGAIAPAVTSEPRSAAVPPRPASVPPRPASKPPRLAPVAARPAVAPERTPSDPAERSELELTRSRRPSEPSYPPADQAPDPRSAWSSPPPPPPPASEPDIVESSPPAPQVSAASPPAPSERIPDSAMPAVLAMRIIAVGESSYRLPSPNRITDRLELPEVFEPAPSAAVDLSPERSIEAAEELADELADDDVAPDSEDTMRGAALRAQLDDALVTAPGEESWEQSLPSAKPHAPPPPPRRQFTPSPAPADEPVSAPRSAEEAGRGKQQRRAWWEELFNEDFVRAISRLSDEQVAREVDFIEESLGVAAGGVVLDLGCGAGYHAIDLALRGYGVVGYDLSLFQLALAADVAQEREQRINFLQGDMREMAFDEMFDGIFCWNTSFGYFEEEKNLAVAQRVFKALRPGGMFLLDVANRDFVAQHQPSQVWYEGDSCVCMDDMAMDFITSRLRVKRSIILDDGRTRECTYSIRLYSLHELGKILHDVGFRVTEASGHPATPGVFFGQCSPRIIILAQRP